MNSKIAITDDLADVFMIQALREGFCDYLTHRNQTRRDGFAEYMVRKSKLDKATYRKKLDRLFQLLILYERIEFPIINNGFVLHGKIKKIANIYENLPPWFYSPFQLTEEELSVEDAIKIKPIVMSAIKNINFSSNHIAYAIEKGGSIKNFYSSFYDNIYTHADSIFNQQLLMLEYDMLTESLCPDSNSPECHILYTNKLITTIVKNILAYFEFNKTQKYDYYSKIFDNFSTETNLNTAYGIVKTQISYIIEQQPAFETLSEIISFRKNKKKAIHDLREEVSSLEYLIKEGAHEAALQKAIRDVRLANEALIKNTSTKRTAQIATYISVPISLIELLTFGTPFSMIIGTVGTLAQFKSDIANKQSDWLFVAR